MTHDELVDDLADRLGLTSDTARDRLARAVNRHHRRISASAGLVTSNYDVTHTPTTPDNPQVTFTNFEKVLQAWHYAGGSRVPMQEITLAQLRDLGDPVSGATPSRFATVSTTATSVTIELDALPDSVYDIFCDGYASLAALVGSMEPAFAQSFHDAIEEAVMADEYTKQEKPALADRAEQRSQKIVNDLKLFLATSPTLRIRQGERLLALFGPGGTGGGTPGPYRDYTQTGLITFSRGVSAPFAVVSGAAVVANLDADLLDGQHGAFYRDAANLNAGIIPAARYEGLVAMTFSAGDFTASGSMTWTVDLSDVKTFKYERQGNKMTVVFTIEASSVGGTPDTDLFIRIPQGGVAASDAHALVRMYDNGAPVVAEAIVRNGNNVIAINRLDVAPLSLSTNATEVQGEITFEVLP